MMTEHKHVLPKAFVFDWDNTLVDNWTLLAETMNGTLRILGREPWSLTEVKAKCTRAARETFPEWFGADWKKAYDIFYAVYDDVKKRSPLRTLNGAGELLLWLHQSKIPSFVVSNKRGDNLRLEAEQLDWTRYFVALVGAQDAPRDKPAREHVDHALAQGGLIADTNIWFVGDTETDILCARNSGCTPVLIGAPEDAARFSVPLVFSDCLALQKLLSKERIGS